MIRTIAASGLCLGLGLAAPVTADPATGSLFAARQPLFSMQTESRDAISSASLFVDRAEGGLFAALPGRLDAPLRHGGTKAARLRDLIARAEAGRAGYDAVQHGARVKPPRRPTDMTLQDIYDWIEATPGQPHAIGRYQFIPPTLRHSAARLDLPASTRFSPAVQDRLADLLLGDAGLMKVKTGEMSVDTFMLNLARIWAGLPIPSGRSYYHGVAGNKATMTYEAYARQVRGILGG
ncbi:hypothetical protein [Roseovarius atlanticus]|uniref:hypothetical protein n=1 Tax=Roseovarius atlanticus TaxID=1641875 RepID=UPI001C96B76B|nr:hypothetical protein [Roseovarius atlanticus]MBY5990135.1 hypothetical protein [Roseovarius atlanticus]MBY6126681.1 hypothetical protein [Roseovarius atlanticus]MBY6151175.1 hypothetical protein [Roseovarius atlanticus]